MGTRRIPTHSLYLLAPPLSPKSGRRYSRISIPVPLSIYPRLSLGLGIPFRLVGGEVVCNVSANPCRLKILLLVPTMPLQTGILSI